MLEEICLILYLLFNWNFVQIQPLLKLEFPTGSVWSKAIHLWTLDGGKALNVERFDQIKFGQTKCSRRFQWLYCHYFQSHTIWNNGIETGAKKKTCLKKYIIIPMQYLPPYPNTLILVGVLSLSIHSLYIVKLISIKFFFLLQILPWIRFLILISNGRTELGLTASKSSPSPRILTLMFQLCRESSRRWRRHYKTCYLQGLRSITMLQSRWGFVLWLFKSLLFVEVKLQRLHLNCFNSIEDIEGNCRSWEFREGQGGCWGTG